VNQRAKAGVWLRSYTIPKGLTRDSKLLYVASFANTVNSGLFFIILQYFLIQLGILGFALGIILALPTVAITIFTIPGGLIADATGRKKSVIFGYLLLGSALVTIPFTSNFVLLAVASFLSGVGSAFISASSGALLAGSMPRESLEQGFSFQYFIGNWAFALGAILAGLPILLLHMFGFSLLDGYRAAILLCSALNFFTLLPLSRLNTETVAKGALRFRLESKRLIAKFMSVNVFVGFGAGLTIPLFAYFYSLKFGTDSGTFGLLSAVASVVGGFFFLAGPRISARWGPVKTIAVTAGCSIPLLVLIPLMPNFLLTIPFFVLRQSLINMNAPLVESTLMGLVKESERATASGVSQVAWNLPNGLGTPLGGAIMKSNPNLPPFLTAGFYSVYCVLWVVIFRNVDLRKNGSDAV
jgi:MFS family permease